MGVYMKMLVKQIDETNEEIADTLISLGMRRPIARVLSYLKNGTEVTSVELEKAQDCTSPKSVLL